MSQHARRSSGIVGRSRSRSRLARAGVVLLGSVAVAGSCSGTALATTQTFTTQGCGHIVGANLFTVPAGVTTVAVVATGSAGGSSSAAGGSGDRVSATLSGLTAGQVLDVCVNVGGGPGGLIGGGVGGGASGLALGSDFAVPVLIAGGGGGAGASYQPAGGGNAGLPAGEAGHDTGIADGGQGGGGGTQATFGGGGAEDPGSGAPGANGSGSSSTGPGSGGAGGAGLYDDEAGGGGGGGGYYGGGGGGGSQDGAPGGGGGGSDFCAASLPTPRTLSGCAFAGTSMAVGGSVVVTYTAATATACDLTLAPVGCWGFDETNGTTALDASGHANNGTYVGGPALGALGVFGTAVSMDGVNDYVRVPDSSSLDVGNAFTLEGWIKRGSTSHSDSLFNKGAGAFQLVALSAASGGRVVLRKANVTTVAQSTAGVPADGRFHHVVATKSAGVVHIYIDGVEGTQLLAPGQILVNNAEPIYVSETAGDRLLGQLDAFAVYGQALTPTQVNARYAAGQPPAA
jgi:Concanavalin A-like lectin/glucanases superfamily